MGVLEEREGFEPSIPIARDNGFQDRRFRPLSHLSKPFNYTIFSILSNICWSFYARLMTKWPDAYYSALFNSSHLLY